MTEFDSLHDHSTQSTLSTPPTPPTGAGSPVEQRKPRSNWPTVIGVICLVLGILGALGGLCNIASSVATPYILAQIPQNEQTPTPAALEIMGRYMWVFLLVFTVYVAVSLFLIAGSIFLIKRSPGSSGLLKKWSYAKIAYAVIASAWTIYYNLQLHELTMRTAEENPTPQNSIEQWTTSPAFTFVTVTLMFVWQLILPVFLLIWFSRQSVKDEVRSWTH